MRTIYDVTGADIRTLLAGAMAARDEKTEGLCLAALDYLAWGLAEWHGEASESRVKIAKAGWLACIDILNTDEAHG